MELSNIEKLLKKTLNLLPVTNEELMLRGITGKLTDRIVDLKKAAFRLQEKYDSLKDLEDRIKKEGVSPDDHTLYNDLLEWRAINHELSELVKVLESI